MQLSRLLGKAPPTPRPITPAASISETPPRICVIGIGGAGENAVTNAIRNGVSGVEFIVASADTQSLANSEARTRIRLPRLRLDRNAVPATVEREIRPALDRIAVATSGSHLCFIAVGMGGATGSTMASLIARRLRQQGIVTVGVATRPFAFEGRRRQEAAERGLEALRQAVDTVIVIPNQKLLRTDAPEPNFKASFELADQILEQGVRSIADLLLKPGLVNLNFSDLRAVMKDMGKAVLGTGESDGLRRAEEAAERAIGNPLLDTAVDGARHVIISVSGGEDMRLSEIEAAVSSVTGRVHPDAEIIWGSSFDACLEGSVRVSVIATGMDPTPKPVAAKTGSPCTLRKHQVQAGSVFNQGFYFSSCKLCGCNLIRSGAEWKPVPRGFRVRWIPGLRSARVSGGRRHATIDQMGAASRSTSAVKNVAIAAATFNSGHLSLHPA